MNINEQLQEVIKGCLDVKIEYLMHGKMQWDDPTSTDTRDIYLVTLTCNGKTYQTQYGQSVMDSDMRKMHKDQVKSLLKDNRKDYFNFIEHSRLPKGRKAKVPTLADVLYSIERNDPYSFDDFCDCFGYDNDSIKAHKIYIEVQKQYHFMMNVPCMDEIDELLQDY